MKLRKLANYPSQVVDHHNSLTFGWSNQTSVVLPNAKVSDGAFAIQAQLSQEYALDRKEGRSVLFNSLGATQQIAIPFGMRRAAVRIRVHHIVIHRSLIW